MIYFLLSLQLITISSIFANAPLSFEDVVRSLPPEFPEGYKKSILEVFAKHPEEFDILLPTTGSMEYIFHPGKHRIKGDNSNHLLNLIDKRRIKNSEATNIASNKSQNVHLRNRRSNKNSKLLAKTTNKRHKRTKSCDGKLENMRSVNLLVEILDKNGHNIRNSYHLRKKRTIERQKVNNLLAYAASRSLDLQIPDNNLTVSIYGLLFPRNTRNTPLPNSIENYINIDNKIDPLPTTDINVDTTNINNNLTEDIKDTINKNSTTTSNLNYMSLTNNHDNISTGNPNSSHPVDRAVTEVTTKDIDVTNINEKQSNNYIAQYNHTLSSIIMKTLTTTHLASSDVVGRNKTLDETITFISNLYYMLSNKKFPLIDFKSHPLIPSNNSTIQKPANLKIPLNVPQQVNNIIIPKKEQSKTVFTRISPKISSRRVTTLKPRPSIRKQLSYTLKTIPNKSQKRTKVVSKDNITTTAAPQETTKLIFQAYPMPQPQPIIPMMYPPMVVPSFAYFEKVVHDHPPLSKIKKIIKKNKKKLKKEIEDTSSDSDSSETDSSSSSSSCD